VCIFTRAATVMKKKSGKLFVRGILRLFHFHVTSSLRRRRILTSVSNVCEEALMSLFWAPKELNELPEERFEFPFILFGKSTLAWRVLKSRYTGEAQNKDFGAVSQPDLTSS